MTSPTAHITPPPPLSLGSDQIALLLRTLRTHRQLLEPAQLEAKRLEDLQQRPCYLVDYQEIYTYIYEEEKRGSTLVPLEYLFDQTDITFLVGPGTLVEIASAISLMTGIDIDTLEQDLIRLEPGALQDKYASDRVLAKLSENVEFLQSSLNAPEDVTSPMQRLLYLLAKENFILWPRVRELYAVDVIDPLAYETQLDLLTRQRPRQRAYLSNYADALNFAAAVTLQQAAEDNATLDFPFLLTHTPSLLRDEPFAHDGYSSRWGFDNHVIRTPLAALYAHIAAAVIPDAPELVHHLTILAYRIGLVERQLRETPGYHRRLDAPEEATWEDLIVEDRISQQMTEEMSALSDVLDDPIVAKAQAVSERAQLSTANRRILVGTSSNVDQQRRLFDIIIGITTTIKARGGASEVLTTGYNDVVHAHTEEHKSFIATTFLDGRGAMFLHVERHEGMKGYFSLAWPTSQSVETLVTVTQDAFARHEIPSATLFLGTASSIVVLHAEFPVLFSAIMSEVPREETLKWMRFESADFDLYFSVPTSLHNDSIAGLIVSTPNPDHIIELYRQTSSRFLFRSWLNVALETAKLGT